MPLLHSRFQRWIRIVPRRAVSALEWVGLLALAWASHSRADETIPFVVQDALYRTNLVISNIDSSPAEVSILLYDNSGILAAQGAVQTPSLGIINLKKVVSFAFGYPVTQVSPFSSTLLVSNLGDSATWIEISHRTEGLGSSAVSRTWLPAQGSMYLNEVLTLLRIPSGYGPLQLRSVEGQPLAAFSHVANANSGVRGAVNSVDTRPSASDAQAIASHYGGITRTLKSRRFRDTVSIGLTGINGTSRKSPRSQPMFWNTALT